MSLSDVTSRIAQLQVQLSGLAPAGLQDPSATTTDGTGFDQVLGAAALSADGSATDAAGAAGATGATGATTGASGSVGDLGATTSGAGATGDTVVADAKRYLGVPYVWGGTDPAKGLDCSGLVQRVFKDLGYSLPRVAADQSRQGTHVDGGLAQARPGDLLTFGSPAHHIGIYVGDGKMIEAPRPGLAVRIAPVYPTPTDIRRVLPAGDGSATATTTTTAALAGGAGDAAAAPYLGLFASAGQTYGVSPRLLEAVARQESGFDPTAVSPAGARGLMQLMPSTARGLGVTDPMNPAQAVDGAARMLRGLLDRFGGRTDLALAAYNAGPGAVSRYGGVPPYAETRQYVQSILADLGSAA